MRILDKNIITQICLILSTTAFFGCAQEEGQIRTTPDLNRFLSSIEVGGPPFSSPNWDNEMQPITETPADVAAENDAVVAAKTLALIGNAPNPFNPATELSFAVPESGTVSLTIHGIDGRRARQLVSGVVTEGEHTVIWRGRDDDGRELPSGVYFVSLQSQGEIKVRKLVMVR